MDIHILTIDNEVVMEFSLESETSHTLNKLKKHSDYILRIKGNIGDNLITIV